MSIYGILGILESKPMLDPLLKEVIGVNAPKIALARGKDERQDIAFNEVGNTVATFGLGGLLDYGLKKLFTKAQSAEASTLSNRWATIGRSGAVYSAIFSMMWAMPFIRNYFTAKRTGKIDFTDVIGAGQNHLNLQQNKLEQAKADYKKKSVTILGAGLGAMLLSVLGAKRAIANQWGEKFINQFFSRTKLVDTLLMKNGSFGNFEEWKTMLFWGLPSYIGWFHASRDPYERKELPLKFLTAVTGFVGVSKGSKALFNHLLKKLKLPEINGKNVELNYKSIQTALDTVSDPVLKGDLLKARRLWASNIGLGLGASVLLLCATQLMNIRLTAKRLERSRKNQKNPTPAMQSGNFQRKTFSQWGQRSNQAAGFQAAQNAHAFSMNFRGQTAR